MMERSAAAADEAGVVFALSALATRLATLRDARQARGKRYALPTLLLLIVLAKLAGEDRPSGIADWVAQRAAVLQTALRLSWRRMPHHNTFRRVLAAAVEPSDLDAAVGAFFREQAEVGQSVVVSIDGKTVRGTISGSTSRGEHLLVAYLPAEGIVLLQMAAGEKQNEISVAPQLLSSLDLRGKVVTGDALHTQRALSAQIVAAGGDYLWIAKDNQPTLRQDIAAVFELHDRTVAGGRVPGERRTASTLNKGHGRQERRTLTASTDLTEYSDWPGLGQVFRLERERRVPATNKVEQEVVYGLTSLPPARATAADLLQVTRTHWGVENGLHYRRDVTFHEDATRLTQGHAGRVMATLNNLVIGVFCQAGFTNHAAARRRCAADLQFSLTLLAMPGRL
jgi:predicted transposase YbfD/YdcC